MKPMLQCYMIAMRSLLSLFARSFSWAHTRGTLLLTLLPVAALLNGCASGLTLREYQECQEFGGHMFEVTALAASANRNIFVGGNVSSLGNCIAPIPGTPGTLAVYQSTDQGETWTASRLPIMQEYRFGRVTSISPGSDGSVFAAVAVRSIGFYSLFELPPWQGHIYRSADDGATWREIAGPPSPGYISSVAAGRGSNVFAHVCGQGVYRSEDAGESWKVAGLGYVPNYRRDPSTCVGDVVAVANGNVYASGFGPSGPGLYRSTDNGATWRRPRIQSADLSTAERQHYGMMYEMAFNAKGQFIVQRSTSEPLFRSTDNGETWKEVNARPEGWIQRLAVGKDGELYAWTDLHYVDFWSERRSRAFRSTDGGKTWVELPSLEAFPSVLAVDPDGVLYRAPALQRDSSSQPPPPFGGEIYRSVDQGSTWHLRKVLPKRPR